MSPANVKGTAGSMEWGTPRDLFERLNRWFAFDYDPFASHENALLPTYSTIEGTFNCGLTTHRHPEGSPVLHTKISDADGLTEPWEGMRVFMNPPYSRGLIGRCVEKAYNERENTEIIVALIPFDPSLRWWNKYVEGHCIVLPLPKRLRFEGAPATGTHPCAVVIWMKALLFRP